MRWIILLLSISIPLPVMASHSWAKIDICKIYEDKLPPGLTANLLPAAPSHGAALLTQYCTQCHNLPGPDRHTASEWHEVTSKMFMLMDVSNKFGGFRGEIKAIQPKDQEILLEYLERHAAESTIPANSESTNHPWLTRTVTLAPLLILTVLGLLRWRRRVQCEHNHA